MGQALELLLTAAAALIGEGLTSPEPGRPIQAGFRLFTLHSGPEACAAASIPASLDAHPVYLPVGGDIRLNDLVITAHADDGTLIPNVPIIISEADESNGVLKRDSSGDSRTWIAAEVGQKNFRVSYACADPVVVSTLLAITVT